MPYCMETQRKIQIQIQIQNTDTDTVASVRLWNFEDGGS